MLRKAPSFWKKNGAASALLSPLSCVYYIAHRIKWALTKPYKAKVPVVCIGGIVAGGSGKTPTIHAVLNLMTFDNLYQKPVVLLRGYGGSYKGPLVVDPQKHTYRDVGDEALLHAAMTTTIISADRAAGAKLAEEIGADLILMDDGLQNNSLVKDFSLLVIDGTQGLGNGKLLPAGPLREPLSDALPRVAAIVQIGEGDMPYKKPIFQAIVTAKTIPDKTKPYFGFAGIGDPYKFKKKLVDLGLKVEGFLPYADHHPYIDADILCLKEMAAHRTLITTAKDYVRIPVSLRDGIEILPIELTFKTPDAVIQMLKALK